MMDNQYRGLLILRCRENSRSEADVSDNYLYRVVSRIRKKVESIDEDVETLERNRRDLLEGLRDVVCVDDE